MQQNNQTPAAPAFVIELESVKPGLLCLLPRMGVVGTLDFAAGSFAKPSRIAVTPEQFLDFNASIEQHSRPVKGRNVDLFLKIWAVNATTGERQEISYEQACAALSVMSSSEAKRLQQEQEARILAEARKRAAEKGMSADGLTAAAEIAQARGMVA